MPNKSFRAHPLMLVRLLKPYLFVLILPLVKGVVQYILHGEVSGVLWREAVAFALILIIALMRLRSVKISVSDRALVIENGIFPRRRTELPIEKISCVSARRNIADAFFGSVSYSVNTEAGVPGNQDFEFKLNIKDAKILSHALYGRAPQTAVHFSAPKIALLSASTSSAITGLIIGVPVINRAGKLLGIALSDMLFNEINSFSHTFNTYFPPVVNTLTAIFIVGYGISFLVSLMRNMNFRLRVDADKMQIESGFFVRKKRTFKKAAVNDVCIEQTPLMHLFRVFTLRAAVGGYGGEKGERAVVVPVLSRELIKSQFEGHFPFLKSRSDGIRAARTADCRKRFFYLPKLYGFLIALAGAALAIAFPLFANFTVFVTMTALGVVAYYANVSYRNYKNGLLALGNTVTAIGSKRFTMCELHCEKERIGEIRLFRTPADIRCGTCKATVSVHSESADSVRVRNIDFEKTAAEILKEFEIEGIKL